MNRGFRGILIASAIALAIGLGLVVAGVVAGASWYDVGDVIFSGKYSFGDGVVWGIGDSSSGKGNKMDSESQILKDIDAKSIEKLTIEMAAGKLDIKEGSSTYFQVSNDEKRGDCYIDHSGDELTVTIKGKHSNSRGARTTFWIPKGLSLADVDIHVDAGQIETDDLNATDLTISVGAGQVKAEGITATDLDITVDAGEFKNNGKIIAEEATLKVAAGNLKVDLLEAKYANVNVDIGHMDVEFTGKKADYNITTEVAVGEAKIDGDRYHMGKQYQSHDSSSDKTIEVECNVGQATIDFEN